MSKRFFPSYENPTLTEDGRIAGILDPTAAQDAATKEYVDTAVANLEWSYYLNDTASGIGAYYEMSQEPTGDAESTFTSDSLGSGDGQALFQWIGDDVVTFDTLELGVIALHLHARRTVGKRSVNLYVEIYEYKADTSEVLIVTTELSNAVEDNKISLAFHATILSDYEIAATSKLLVKLLANIGSTGADSTIAIYAEGTDNSRISVPVPSESLSSLFVLRSLYNAQTILQATSDNTPVPLSITEQTVVGRLTGGNIAALTAAQILALVSPLTTSTILSQPIKIP